MIATKPAVSSAVFAQPGDFFSEYHAHYNRYQYQYQGTDYIAGWYYKVGLCTGGPHGFRYLSRKSQSIQV